MTPPKLNKILETALYVSDLPRAVAFYQTIFGFEILFGDERLCALNVENEQVLLLFRKGASTEPLIIPGGVIPPNDGDGQLHVCFAIEAGELENWANWLAENNVAIESRVTWERGGTSLYFRDGDEHLIELATRGLWTIY